VVKKGDGSKDRESKKREGRGKLTRRDVRPVRMLIQERDRKKGGGGGRKAPRVV